MCVCVYTGLCSASSYPAHNIKFAHSYAHMCAAQLSTTTAFQAYWSDLPVSSVLSKGKEEHCDLPVHPLSGRREFYVL